MPGFYIAGRTARPDMVLVVFILLATVLLGASMQPRPPWSRRALLLLAGVAAGIATVTKGPYGFLFPFVFVAFAPWQNPKLQRPTWEFLWFALGIILVVGGWATAVYDRADGAYLRSVVFQKDLSSGGGAGHYEPFYWYLGSGFIQTLPVIVFLPWSVIRWRRERRFPAALIMAATLFLVLSLMPGKRRHYLLPALPFFALALAEGWIDFAERGVRWRRAGWAIVVTGLVANPAYYGPVVKWLRPEGDTEYRYVTAASALLPPQANVICFGNMDENLAWIRRTTSGIRSVRLPEQAATILRRPGTATHLMLSRKHFDALRQIPDVGEFEILLERPIDRRDSWLLVRPVVGSPRPISRPAP
jgi:4-amino-4-deoxy-L-arabinose transferase-like glycosyltransferase